MVKKVLLWGMGDDYEKLLNSILFEIHKGNIVVEAVVCKEEDIFCPQRDGFRIISQKDIKNYEFEYILVMSSHYFKEIKNQAISEGISENRIIDASVFSLQFFDFKLYASLLENPVTIISDDCWSGYVYNRLKLPFSTPFINIYIENDEYIKLIRNLEFFLSTELKMEREGNLQEGIFPIASLGDETNKVNLQLVHDATFAQGKERWDRRKARINLKNIFVKMRFSISDKNKEALIDAFQSVPYKKILFYNGNEEIYGKFKTDRFIWRQYKMDRIEQFCYYDYCRLAYKYDIDILKLLNGDGTYSRYGGGVEIRRITEKTTEMAKAS